MQLKISYLYPKELNLYGDTGNVEILMYRLQKRNIRVELHKINSTTKINSDFVKNTDILFIGGGPDSGQKEMYQDLIENKGPYIKDYIESGGIALFICGSYQLMGNYYKSADGYILDGIGIFNLHTQHFGHAKPRCVGNTVYELNSGITEDPVYKNLPKELSSLKTIVGFENHGGRTYLHNKTVENNNNNQIFEQKPFATVLVGNGNNSEDKTEGVHYKNAIGTYSHGPILSKNPHLADYLIFKAIEKKQTGSNGKMLLQQITQRELDDKIILHAHSALLRRFT